MKTQDVTEAFHEYLIDDVTLIVDTSAETIEDMIDQKAPVSDVQSYLERKSAGLQSIISGDTKGIYGYVMGTFVDGDKWVPDASYDPQKRDWYIKAKEAGGTKTLVDPYVDARTGKLVITASKLLSDGESVLAIDIWLSRMQQMVEDVGNTDKDHDVMIIDNNGIIIAHSQVEEVGLNYKDSDDKDRKNFYDEWQANNGNVFVTKFKGTEYIVCPKEISAGWNVVTITSAEPVFKALNKLTRNIFISAAMGLIITFLVLLNVSRQKIMVTDYDENIHSIANIYTSMHKIDLETYDFEEITCKDEKVVKELDGKRVGADHMIKSVMAAVTDERSKDEVLEFVDLSTLDERMGSSNTISTEFLNYEHKWYRGRFVAAERKPDGNLKSVIWAVEQIDKEKRSRDKLRYLAEIDQMTKLYNRGSGEDKVRKLLNSGEGGMFVLFDVDKFKKVNDSFGHAVGDKVLIAIGKCMKKTFREHDIILRLGGDEFAAFAHGVCESDHGKPVIDRLLNYVEKISIPEMNGQKIYVSIGVAFYKPEDTFTFDELYKRADNCAYLSKKREGSCATYYDKILGA
ncbi:MAG: sensor domain-containing diguanylate cyclase [Butyrivibrio sp.]|nr:sensor domain-containing diguanylate cyclase [Butyrivibrio sp.]